MNNHNDKEFHRFFTVRRVPEEVRSNFLRRWQSGRVIRGNKNGGPEEAKCF